MSEHSYSKGRTPLTFAALSGDAYRVRTLLGGGADPNEVDEEGSTTLILAMSSYRYASRLTIVNALLEGWW